MVDARIKTVLLLGLLSGLILFAGRLIGGTQGMTLALIFAAIFNFGSYFWSDKIILRIYRAAEADSDKHRHLIKLVREVTAYAKIPMPKVYIIPSNTPNAFATGRNPNNAAVAFTQSILDLLDDRQLKGVIAHELSHIKNRDILIATIAATMAAAISYVATMARWAYIFGSRDENGPGMVEFIVLAVLTPIIAVIIQLAISRQREFVADSTGARFVHDAEGLASALKALESSNHARPMRGGNSTTASLFIVNPFKRGALLSLFSTHPPMDERIRRLRALRV